MYVVAMIVAPTMVACSGHKVVVLNLFPFCIPLKLPTDSRTRFQNCIFRLLQIYKVKSKFCNFPFVTLKSAAQVMGAYLYDQL